MKTKFPKIFAGLLPMLFLCGGCGHANADDFSNIGCGNPGLKVIAKQWDPNAVVIYHELPETPFGGFTGVFMTNENIQVIVDHGFNFHKDMFSFTAGVPLELYPFGTNSAFTDETGIEWSWVPWDSTNDWISMSSRETCYILTNGVLTLFTNVQQAARAKYHLDDDDIFLGFLDSQVFFCKNLQKPDQVFWREQGSQKEYSYPMPRGVRNVFGVTKAFAPDKDVGFVVLRPTPLVWPPWDNWFLPPYSDGFIEVSLSKGKLVRDAKQRSNSRT